MWLPGGTPPAPFFLALCVWRLVPRRAAAGTEEVVFGKVGGSILLLCRNVSKEATEVVWFQGDPHSFPPLFSSRVTFPPDVRFSLVDNSSLRITELRVQDEGNYTCKEVLNKTDHEHKVRLVVAKPVNIVGVVGAVVVLSLLAVLTIAGIVLYYSHLLCLRGAALRNQDSGDILVLVDSEDDDEGEEETMSSSTKHEAVVLVDGSNAQAAYLHCLAEGDDGEQHGGVSLQETRGEEARGTQFPSLRAEAHGAPAGRPESGSPLLPCG
ncbi:V-set and immunoglobulin domain-containing protein 10 [Tyto alba]|uniref:V-set and immunoglobulin domain-containing protein 10 n=1 Tax=Tyto alba TaxID=56313 RepID=UPI001C6864E1|nr:V-set and immunoglobulin domain-containing protein 10 [Tyto alba]